jgi:oxygen-independent coproporphyrinogen-3 oxidase
LEKYLSGEARELTSVSAESALQEAFFLGLRMNRGVDLADLAGEFGRQPVAAYDESISELIHSGLLERSARVIRLTPKGRMLSNEVFELFISADFAV